jgi:hypothetical protein
MGVPPLFYLFIPMALAWPLQVVHCVLDRGSREAVKWFGFAILYGLAREILVANTIPLYRFPGGVSSVAVVPVAIGWTFAFYVGDMVARGFLRRVKPEHRPRVLPESMQAGIAACVTASVAFSIEVVAVGMGWWSWAPAVRAHGWMVFPIFTDVPLFVIFGWALSCFAFVFVYDFLNDARRAARYGSARFLMLLVIPAHYAGIVYGNWLFTTAWSVP